MSGPFLVVLLLSTLALTGCDVPLARGPFTYYVSADGDDGATGLRPRSAWRTLERVNEMVLEPGDTVRLIGNRALAGTLTLSAEDAGERDRPVTITADPQFPGIEAVGTAGIKLIDVSGVLVEHIDVLVRDPENTDGILLYATKGSGRHGGITIRNSRVTGARNGIAVDGPTPNDGFDRVTIDRVRVTESLRNGIITYGPEAPGYAHSSIHITGTLVSDTKGIAGLDKNSGSGIVLGSVDGAVVEHSEATRNGRDADAVEGPIGIWAHDATGVVFRDNLSHNNLSRRADGGGFGFDVATTDSLMERNYAHSNMGPGFLVLTHLGGGYTGRNTVRYNASVGDSRLNNFHGGISIIGGFDDDRDDISLSDIHVHHNTVLAFRSSGAAALQMMGYLRNVQVHHNIFDVTGDGVFPVSSRMINPDSTVTIFANQLGIDADDGRPVFIWDDQPVYGVDTLGRLLPDSYWNFATPTSFADRSEPPGGLVPEPVTSVTAEVPPENSPAEVDLMGNSVLYPDPTVGAVSRAG